MRRFAAFLLPLALFLVGCTATAPPRPLEARRVPASTPVKAPEGIVRPEVGFSSRRSQADHFAKHGRQVGARDELAYLRLAQTLRDAPPSNQILFEVRNDGVRTKFSRIDGGFVAFNRDLTIRTYFRPDDGERYFRRQLSRP